MSMPHPSVILKGLEQRARRRFGQHFLCRTDVVDAMARRAGVHPGDRVLEIGPGLGVLTDALLRAGADLTVVELDRDLADYMEETFPQVRLVRGDALKQDWPEVCPGEGWKVVANLPYNVGTHVVMGLLRHPGTFDRIAIMLQREVIDRMMAEPGSKTYGALSVQVQVRARIIYLLGVPPAAFHPPPKVQSTVAMLAPYKEPDTGGKSMKHFDRVVKGAFANRRKTVLNSLSSMWPRDVVRDALERANIDPGLRAEVIDLAAYRRLSAALPA